MGNSNGSSFHTKEFSMSWLNAYKTLVNMPNVSKKTSLMYIKTARVFLLNKSSTNYTVTTGNVVGKGQNIIYNNID